MTAPRITPVTLGKGEHAPEDSIEAVLRRLGAPSGEEKMTIRKILESLDPQRVRTRAPHCERLFATLEEALS